MFICNCRHLQVLHMLLWNRRSLECVLPSKISSPSFMSSSSEQMLRTLTNISVTAGHIDTHTLHQGHIDTVMTLGSRCRTVTCSFPGLCPAHVPTYLSLSVLLSLTSFPTTLLWGKEGCSGGQIWLNSSYPPVPNPVSRGCLPFKADIIVIFREYYQGVLETYKVQRIF